MRKHSFAGVPTANSLANSLMSQLITSSQYHFMGVCMLGPGHDRAFNNCARRFHTRVGGHRQVYQVDRVQANRNALYGSSGYFHLRHLTSFWLPNTIIIDLGSNFHLHQFCDFCERSSIEVKYVLVAHPRANAQVERANGLILVGLKKRLYDENNKKGGKWINEISSVV
ncbi:putative gag-pol precursor [Panicum miliaceum]|uniref:Gag-pol n=1 Tax=Panicum miliaceum TaxID=4540 RepID=A0A3L6QID9_PANMI|nr:putative gag-pol precursor [Panicum miliaceum]